MDKIKIPQKKILEIDLLKLSDYGEVLHEFKVHNK